MSTTYFEEELSIPDSEKKRRVELFVCDFHGPSQLYLRVDDNDSRTMVIDKEQAKSLVLALQVAMGYLGYAPHPKF